MLFMVFGALFLFLLAPSLIIGEKRKNNSRIIKNFSRINCSFMPSKLQFAREKTFQNVRMSSLKHLFNAVSLAVYGQILTVITYDKPLAAALNAVSQTSKQSFKERTLSYSLKRKNSKKDNHNQKKRSILFVVYGTLKKAYIPDTPSPLLLSNHRSHSLCVPEISSEASPFKINVIKRETRLTR